MTNPFKTITGWDFLNEPLWRWFLFLFAVIAMLAAWAAILHRV